MYIKYKIIKIKIFIQKSSFFPKQDFSTPIYLVPYETFPMSFPNCIFEIYKIFTYECIKTIRCRRRYLNKNTLPAFGPRRGNF